MMRLGFVVADISRAGGVQKVVGNLCNSLVKSGRYDLRIISLFRSASQPWPSLDQRVTVDYLFGAPFDWRKSSIRVVLTIRRYLRDAPVELLVVSGMGLVPVFGLAAAASCSLRKIKVLGWEHQSFEHGRFLGSEWIGKRMAAYLFEGVVVLTREDEAAYRSHLTRAKGIYQIYNIVHVHERTDVASVDAKNIVSAGSLVERKGFIDAVRVGEIVLARHPDWHWRIFGEGSEREFLSAAIASRGLESNMHLMGHVDELHEQYRDHALFVLTSRNEGLPTVVIEAKANGLPVVSFACPAGPKELVREGVDGFLIEPGDVERMAERIIELIESPDMRRRFARAAPRGNWRFSENTVVRAWEALFVHVLKG